MQEEIKPNYEDELGITFGKNFWNEFESQRGIKYEMREDEFERYGATIRDALHEQDLTQFHFWLQVKFYLIFSLDNISTKAIFYATNIKNNK